VEHAPRHALLALLSALLLTLHALLHAPRHALLALLSALLA
jgi:hypothetical protein